MKGSIIILVCFLVGILSGCMGLLPPGIADGQASTYALYALMFFAGVSIGCDSEMVHKFLSIDRRILLLPFVGIAGTLLACAVVSFLLPLRSMPDCMAVGSGMAYYSLSSIMVTGLKGPELGTITLIANVIRELTVLLSAPLMVKYFDKLAPISAGGANTMDTTLPVIMRSSGNEYSVPAIYNGIVVTFLVPFIVTFFCSI